METSGVRLERETGFEPATFGLGSHCSTTELLPLGNWIIHDVVHSERTSNEVGQIRKARPGSTGTGFVLEGKRLDFVQLDVPRRFQLLEEFSTVYSLDCDRFRLFFLNHKQFALPAGRRQSVQQVADSRCHGTSAA
jgi:hypothetical protein